MMRCGAEWRHAIATCSLVLFVANCATQQSAWEIDALRQDARGGGAMERRALAEAIATGRVEGGALAEAADAVRDAADPAGRALAAVIAEALGRVAPAQALWREVLAAPATQPWLLELAALRLLALVDRVALGPDDAAAAARALERLDGPSPAVAELAEAVAARRGDAPLAARARQRRGWVVEYTRTGRVAGWPALASDPSLPPRSVLDASLEGARGLAVERVETPDGTVAFAEDGPGLYVASITAPASAAPLVLELISEPAIAVFDLGERVAFTDRLGALAPVRTEVRLAAGPERQVELQVSSRAAAPTVRVAIRPAPLAAPAEAPGPDTLLARLARLEAALFDRDALGAALAAEALSADARGVALSALVRQEIADPSRPSALSSSRVRTLLEAASVAIADHVEARALLAATLAGSGEATTARAMAEGLPAGPLRDDLLLALDRDAGATEQAAARAEAALAQAPTSCRALAAVLDLRWERLRHGALALPERLPRCGDLELRLASLEADRGDTDAARRRLATAAAEAPPGLETARLRAAQAEVAWRGGDPQAAADSARAGLEERVAAEELLVQWRRAAIVSGSEEQAAAAAALLRRAPRISAEARRPWLDPADDLGLPLPDGEALARAVQADAAPVDAPVDVVLSERHVRILPDGTAITREYLLFRIVEAGAADRWGEVGLPDGAELLVARTWKPTPEGGLQPIEPEDLAETGAVSLTALEPGAFGEVAWVTIQEGAAAFFASGRLEDFAFESDDAAVRRARLVVRTEPGWPLVYDRGVGVPEPERPDQGTLIFEMTRRERVIVEPLDPRPDRRLATVAVGWGADLRALRLARADRARSLLVPTPGVGALIGEALSGLGAGAQPGERLRALYATALDTIQGGDGGVWQQSASFIATTRSGERAVLLTAACRQAGMACDLVLARPKSRGAVDESARLGDPDDWAYPLVHARLPEGEIWLDPSEPFVPFGYIPPLVQGVEALPLTAGGDVLLRTPAMLAEGGEHRIDIEVDVAADGRFSVRGAEQLTGLYAMGWRHVLADLLPEARERGLAGVVRQSFPGVRVDAVELSELRGREVPLGMRWSAEGELPKSRSLTLALSPESLSAATVKVPERTAPLFISRASNLRVSVTLRLPPGLSVRQPPTSVAIDGPLLAYRRDVALGAGSLVITKTFRLDLGTVEPAQYPAWVAAVRALDRADVLHLTLETAR
jgi:hypothetical protein